MCNLCECCGAIVETLTLNGYCEPCEAMQQKIFEEHDAMLDEMYEAYIASLENPEPV
jgi:Zn finger protein HypA/HybF involved in hydrogenase expression